MRSRTDQKETSINLDAPSVEPTPSRGEVIVVIPAYNEQDSIRATIADVRKHCPWADVVVVSDGSTDATAERAAETGALVLTLAFNLGIGGAVQTGFLYASAKGYRVVVQVDGDGQHPASEVGRIVGPVLAGDADIVVGSRFLGSGVSHASTTRALGIRVLARVVSIVTRQRFTDPTSGFRAYSNAAAAHVSRDYPYDYPEPEALVNLRRNGFRIMERAVSMRERSEGVSSIDKFGSLRYMIKVMIAISVAVLRPQSKRFAPTSAFLRRQK